MVFSIFTFVALSAAAADCPPGQAITAETLEHCCWPNQVWSRSGSVCKGVPACPSGFVAEGEACIAACAAGQIVTAETAGRCCWPNQVWAQSAGVCKGLPACPAGLVADGETCLAVALTQAPPAPAAPAPAPVTPVPATPPRPSASVTTVQAAPQPIVHRPNWMVFTGAALFLLGWVPTLIMPAAYGSYVPNANDVAPIPLAGPLLVRERISDYNLEHAGFNAITITAALFQWVGFGLLATGAVMWGVGAEAQPAAPIGIFVTPSGAGALVAW